MQSFVKLESCLLSCKHSVIGADKEYGVALSRGQYGNCSMSIIVVRESTVR